MTRTTTAARRPRFRARPLASVILVGAMVLSACGSQEPGKAVAAATAGSEAAASQLDLDSDALSDFIPSDDNPDPSKDIEGTFIGNADDYEAIHVTSDQRVAYDRFPPVGGPHDATWAACNGVVYPVAVRNENMVHALEHGAVWIAYNPDTLDAADLALLENLVDGQQFLLMSPYPGLTSTLSLQSWGHQLALESATDERLLQFIVALRQNPNTYQEVGATCSQPTFDIDNPPAFDPSAPGSDAVPMTG